MRAARHHALLVLVGWLGLSVSNPQPVSAQWPFSKPAWEPSNPKSTPNWLQSRFGGPFYWWYPHPNNDYRRARRAGNLRQAEQAWWEPWFVRQDEYRAPFGGPLAPLPNYFGGRGVLLAAPGGSGWPWLISPAIAQRSAPLVPPSMVPNTNPDMPPRFAGEIVLSADQALERSTVPASTVPQPIIPPAAPGPSSAPALPSNPSGPPAPFPGFPGPVIQGPAKR